MPISTAPRPLGQSNRSYSTSTCRSGTYSPGICSGTRRARFALIGSRSLGDSGRRFDYGPLHRSSQAPSTTRSRSRPRLSASPSGDSGVYTQPQSATGPQTVRGSRVAPGLHSERDQKVAATTSSQHAAGPLGSAASRTRPHIPASGCQRCRSAPVGSLTVLTIPLGVLCVSSTTTAPSDFALLVAATTSGTEM